MSTDQKKRVGNVIAGANSLYGLLYSYLIRAYPRKSAV